MASVATFDFDNIGSDMAAEEARTEIDDSAYLYITNRNYYMRPGINKCRPQAVGQSCSFYAPLNNDLPSRDLTRDSYMRGLGQSLSDDPNCQVKYYPDSLFSIQSTAGQAWSGNSLEQGPMRSKKSCNGMSDIDTYRYSQMPGAFQKGYQGLEKRMFVDSRLESRDSYDKNYGC